MNRSSSYQPVLAVEVVWHPRFAEGRKIAEALETLLNRPPVAPGGGGLNIPVLFRSASATEVGVPAPIPFASAKHTAVVLLVEDELVADDAWVNYSLDLFESLGKDHRVFPVKLSAAAFNLGPSAAGINFIRPLGDHGLDAASLTRLTNALLHEFCLLLAEPAPDSGRARVKVFISHAKADGEPIAKAIKRHIQDHSQLGTFFDVNDIEYGASFDPVLRREVRDGTLLVVQTDHYSASHWCLEEMLEAKAHQRPVLVVHAVTDGEARAGVYGGNVPTCRHDSAALDALIGRLLLEVLRRDHFMAQLKGLQAMFNLPADAKALPYPPEPLTIADMKVAKEPVRRIVYPDPPLSAAELARLHALEPGLKVTTPLLWMAEVWETAPSLAKRPIGISVGNAPEMAAAGLTIRHLNAAAFAFARYMLACGMDLVYGGHVSLAQSPGEPSPVNFLELLADVVRAHRAVSTPEDRPRLRNFIAKPYEPTITARLRAQCRGLMNITIVPEPAAPLGDREDQKDFHLAQCLTAMRKEMTAATRGRVLLGGKATHFSGTYPGIVEEARIALEAGQPVYVIGAFGGGARAVAEALQGRTPLELQRQYQESHSAKFRVMAALHDQEAEAGRATPMDYPGMVNYFNKLGTAGLSARNGLTVEENLRLFTTPHVTEIVALVLRGLVHTA